MFRETIQTISKPLAKVLLLVLLVSIRSYQFLLSPMLGPRCRFYPSCSEYAREALLAHGCCKGGWLSLKRLLCCHPWHEGGYDPVPDPEQNKVHVINLKGND